jgi:hypothetical protein
MSVSVPQYSRLRFGELVKADGVEFWDVLDLPTIPEQRDDFIYTVKGPDRIDTLANQFYNDSRLWWVIAVANDMEDVMAAFNVGVQLRIPSPRYVTQLLFKSANIQRS